MEYILGYLFIFVARIIDVSMGTIRMLMIVRGKRYHAAIIGFFEVTIFIVALGRVMTGFDNVGNVLAYSSGFATGSFLGSFLEEKMAMGTMIAQVISKLDAREWATILRESGFGVTIVEGQGKEGVRYILNVTLERKKLRKFYEIMNELDPNAFITITDARVIKGGYFTKLKIK